MAHYDVAIIGAGHNGLVCAAYLAAHRLRVIVAERRGVAGGAAVTEEFHPGFRNSTASYTVSLLHPRVINDLDLRQHGLRIVRRPYGNFLPLPDGGYLRTGSDLADTQLQFGRFSRRDANRLPDYYAMLERGARLLRDLMLTAPPNAGGGLRDVAAAVRLGARLRNLDMTAARDVLELFTRSAGDLLDHWFESEPIKALLAFDSVVGNFASPYAPGTAYMLLHHAMGEINGQRGQWGHAVGGMGAISQAMLSEVLSRGVVVRTDAAVDHVLIHDGAATGLVLAGGEIIHARAVAAGVNPRLLFARMVDRTHLEQDFLERIDRYRCGSASFRINVALAELPRFSCATPSHPALGTDSGIIVAPSLRYMERAYFDARQRGWSRQPILEMLVPSTVDDSLAPAGQHVASLFCQHFSPELENATWDDSKDAAVQTVFDTVERYAPNFKASIIGVAALTPLDLEREFGLLGGDIFHGAMGLDQLFSARPVLGHGHYRSPISGLYLCGSGTHPGGGVTGAPGHNAAAEIIRDFRARRLRKV